MGPPGSTLKFSENFQDMFVLSQTFYKENGYFVDIGASDGITGSNTFLLEKFYKWRGICVDPNPVFLQSLHNCRNSHVSNLCVYNESGKIIPFKFYNNDFGFFGWNFRSGIEKHLLPVAEEQQTYFENINVFTITLEKLLKLYNAPQVIDYLSLDTEGSEYEILKGFNFNLYKIKCITVEHAFTDQQEKIYSLLTSNGYRRVDEHLNYQEDRYVLI
jgi:FkbM family methyltransferase